MWDRRPNFVIFVVLGALIVRKWVVVAFIFCVPVLIQGWGTQSQSKISSFCFWYGSSWQRFYVQKRVSSRFSCLAPGIERFSLDLPWAIKKNLPWKWGEGVCGICDHRQKKFFYSVILIWGKQWEILIVGINKCCLWWCRLLNLNPGAWGEHFTHQLPCVNAWLLHTCLPCLPSRWVSPYVLCPLWLG